MKKVGLFLDEIKDSNLNSVEKFRKLGCNTGNMLFWYSLKTNVNLDVKSPWYIKNMDQLNIKEYKAFITTDLIWIRQMVDFSYLDEVLDNIGDLPLLPISIGLQANDFITDFKLHPNTVKVIQRISERCVMGVRGNYTAEILSRYGIRNFEVIGCPSMYMQTQGFNTVSNKCTVLKKIAVNFETFYSRLDKYKIDFLIYSAEHNFDFVEQTQGRVSEKNISDLSILSQIRDWLKLESHCFFDIENWGSYMRTVDFSMGLRFHGNVIALWEGVPSLFFTCDSRTKELCEFYSLPIMKIEDFDKSQPLEYYYEKADYSSFHKNYFELIKRWNDFLRINNLL